MTNPTADAAKLLPSGCPVPGCPATGDGKPYAGVPTCMQGYAGDPAAYENYIRGCILRANTRPQPATPSNEWRHIANEWADAATNGLQWLRNVRDGVSKPEDGIAEMENNIPRIRALQPPARPEGEPDWKALRLSLKEWVEQRDLGDGEGYVATLKPDAEIAIYDLCVAIYRRVGLAARQQKAPAEKDKP